MYTLGNFIKNEWVNGSGDGQLLHNAVTGDPIARAGSGGLDFEAMANYARRVGNPALRKMTFPQRGRMLRALALHLQQYLPAFYALSYQSGATKNDSWIDIEGGIGNLFAYASLRRKLPDETFFVDGESHNLGKQNSFMATHLLIPKEGVAVHINAFNFPVWGMLEKLAVNFMAGVPAIVKPATVTAFLTEAVVREIIASGILPNGALQLICGSAGDLLNHLQSQDVVSFTGSAATAQMLKAHPVIMRECVPFNMEADSLNCIVLGNDVEPGSPDWLVFIKEVRKEMTVKAGQKCTAIRRIFVPENKLDAVWKDIATALGETTIGNPLNDKVKMGSLAGLAQRKEVREQVTRLLAGAQLLYGSLDSVQLIDADAGKGAFISPILLLNQQPFKYTDTHEVEAFGPVSTIMPYKNMDDAIELSRMGKGSLCSTIVTGDPVTAKHYVMGAGAWHGRILILNNQCAKESTGHGSPLPLLVHGGPGRAGGGEEMGGLRGIKHYMQRVAIQGSPDMLTSVTGIYQPNATGLRHQLHPFRKYFEEIKVGDQLLTGKRTITDADITNFANLSWDHFYAHTDHGALEGTIFEKPVAHGYFILSAAAGLFVDGSAKGPVLLNYGLDELRFTEPVYAGSTIQVQFTCKEKIAQEQKSDTELPKGIVKWYVEVFNEKKLLVAVATILTMVQKKES
jgi:oxepin-CoA hydrolase / 3-oxo-5,6-dehydrosuberyl-CoA semialdehyde dehydrogenase